MHSEVQQRLEQVLQAIQNKNLEKRIRCGKNIISEYDEEIPKNITAEEILVRSGNIGSVRIAQKIGIEKFKSFLDKLGITEKIDFDIEEVGSPLPLTWGKCKLATSSFGHGITTTALQLTKAYAIISNPGYLVKPTLITQENFDKFNNNFRGSFVPLKKGLLEFVNWFKNYYEK